VTVLVAALSILSMLVGLGLMQLRSADAGSGLCAVLALAFLTGGWFFLVVALTRGLHKIF
jgi:hypothetical protein